MSALPREEQRLLDGLAVCALSALAFVPLATSFAGVGWWVLAGIAVLVGVVLAERAAAWEWPGTLLVLAVLIVYVLLGCPAPSLTRELAQMLPTPAGLAELFRNTLRCWGDLIGTLPRVDSTGPVMLVPLVLGLFPATAAMGLAAMTRSAGMPVVPLVVQFAASLALGRAQPELGLPLGLAFAAVGLAWVSARGRRTGPEADGGVVTGLRRWVAGALVLALAAALAPVVADAVAGDRPRLLLRESVARGADTTKVQTPLRNFRRYTAQSSSERDNVHDTVLMRVRGAEAGDRLRFAVLDWYDGEQWRPNPDRSPVDSMARFLRLSSTIDNPSPGTERSVQVEVRRAWRLSWVPTIGALQSFEFLNFSSTDRRDELTYNPATSTALLGEVLRGVDDYAFTAKVPTSRLTRTMTAASGVDEELYLRASFLAQIAEAYRIRTDTPMQALFAAAAALKRTGRYSDGASTWERRRFPPGHGIDRLDQQFLHAAQMVGNDEQYAATMALLAIRLGIPARVVVGAVMPRDAAQGAIVRGRNVHAWIEVQIADGSWRTLPTERFMGTRPPKRKLPPPRDPDFSSWQPPPPRPQDPPLREEPKKPETKKEEKPDSATDEGPQVPWWLAVLMLVLAAVPALKALRRRLRRTRGAATTRVAAGWNELTDHARDLGAEWSAGATRPGEARQVGTPLALAQHADAAVFTHTEVGEEEVERFWEAVAAARRDRSAAVPRWRRVVAPFNPITLLRRR